MTFTQLCPRCHQSNRCGTATTPESTGCWCTELSIPEGLKPKIQKDYGNDSCLCKNCLRELIAEYLKQETN